MTVPDPHEAVGATSFCQGVGLGPRAFAGRRGAASVDGNGLDLRASYMAQGMGYWRALGYSRSAETATASWPGATRRARASMPLWVP